MALPAALIDIIDAQLRAFTNIVRVMTGSAHDFPADADGKHLESLLLRKLNPLRWFKVLPDGMQLPSGVMCSERVFFDTDRMAAEAVKLEGSLELEGQPGSVFLVDIVTKQAAVLTDFPRLSHLVMGIDLFILFPYMTDQTGIYPPLIRPAAQKKKAFSLSLAGHLMAGYTGKFSFFQRKFFRNFYSPLLGWNDTYRVIVRLGPFVVMATLAHLDNISSRLQMKILIPRTGLFLMAQKAEGAGFMRIDAFSRLAKSLIFLPQQEGVFIFFRQLVSNMAAWATDLIVHKRQRKSGNLTKQPYACFFRCTELAAWEDIFSMTLKAFLIRMRIKGTSDFFLGRAGSRLLLRMAIPTIDAGQLLRISMH